MNQIASACDFSARPLADQAYAGSKIHYTCIGVMLGPCYSDCMIIQVAGCILLDEQGRICLLHRNKDGVTQWELPGGKLHPDETPQNAAIREIQEELGVKVAIQKQVGSTTVFGDDGTQYNYTWFVADIKEGVPTVCEPDTFDDCQYHALDELSNLQLSSIMQELVVQLNDGRVSL